MSTKEETCKRMGFGFCHSLMGKCFNPGSKEGIAGEFNFKNCEQLMKQFCGEKDGKFDFGKFWSKIEKYWKEKNKESNDKVDK